MMRIILVVDDSNSARDIQNRLQRASYDVTTMTATADEVITRADELRPDVILMDVRLKGETDGIEVAQQIKSRHDIPIIFITANADEATVRRAIAAEPDGFLIMPLDALELRAAIEIAIHRHGTEAKAGESDRHISELTESLSEVIFETDMTGTITFVNQVGLKEFGYTKEQVEGGMTLYDFVPPDKQEEIRESIAQAVIDEPSEWMEVPGLRRDGSTFPVSVRASLIVREGVPVGIRGIALNVTEQKRAEQKLEESERQLRELTDTLPVVVYEADETSHVTFVNATAFNLFGYTKEELEAGMSILQLVIDADEERARTMFSLRMGEDDVGRVEYTGRRKDGSTFPISVRGAPIRLDGAVVGVRGIIVDITERKQAEEKVKEYTHTIEILNHIVTEGNRATEVQSFAEAATKLACELMHFDIGGIYLIDTDARYATLRYAQGLPETARDAIEKIPYHDAPFSAVLIDGNPLFAEDYVSFLPQHAPLGAASLASVPLYSQDTIVGALNVGSATRYTFSQAEKDLLIAIGNEVGTVIAKLQAEEALREREEMLQLILNASEDAIGLLDTDGVFQTANEALARRFGVTPAEVIGMKGFTEKPKVVSKQRRAHFARAIATKLPVHFDDEHAGRRLESVYYPIVDARGNVTKVAVFSRDVTELIHAQEELKRQRDQAQLYLDTANVTMVALNREGRITLLNRNGCELLGVTPEEAVGTDWFKTFLPEDVRTEMWGVFETLMAGDWGMYSYYENPVLTSRGEERIVAWHTSLLNDDRGNVIGALNSGTDVTERVRADQKLRESEQRIRDITDALPVVVYETDATGRLTFVNATAFDLYGYTKEELEAGMAIFQLIATADQERAHAVFLRRMRGEDVGRIEYAGLRKDGSTFPISIRSALMRRDGAVVGQRGVILGITELKQAEERMEEHTRTIEILNLVMTEGNRAASVQSFAETVTDLTLELLHFDAGMIHIVEDDARRAKLRYVTGLPDTAVEAIREIPLNEPPYAAFLVEPRPLFLDGHEVSRVPHVAELGLKSFAVVPLYRYDEIIGAFNVGSFKRHTFSQAEKELLIAIGNEVGVVIAKLQADEFIRAALKERETLLKEIHHRVKNNMQVVSSLLSLQAAQATEPETIEILDESQRQIRSMALIHEKLYRSGSLAEIDFGDYVKSLVDDLLQMYNVPGGAITIAVDIENVQLGVDTAIPCGLIINELASNSLKYAFPDGRTGDVTVALQCANGVHTLTVADDGVGFPADLDFRTTDSLGMQLVTALVNQLEGTITLDRTKGTTFIITFKPVVARVEKSGEK